MREGVGTHVPLPHAEAKHSVLSAGNILWILLWGLIFRMIW